MNRHRVALTALVSALLLAAIPAPALAADYPAQLERIQAAVLAINSADDERNPAELGVLDREIKRVKNGRALLIPVGEQTVGHGTTARAALWKSHLAELLQGAPRLAK